MADDRKHSPAEADQILARAASLDAEGEGSHLSAEEIRESALAAGIAPHAVERALKESRSGVPALAAPSGKFAGLAAVPRAQARVVTATPPSVKDVAMKLRVTLGADARISEELGTVRARTGNTMVTVVPGATTLVTVSSDHSASVAVTGIAFGAGGVLSALLVSAIQGSDWDFVLGALAVGGAAGVTAWQVFWRRFLAGKAREVDQIAASVAAAIEG
jgi:hypothetical protein